MTSGMSLKFVLLKHLKRTNINVESKSMPVCRLLSFITVTTELLEVRNPGFTECCTISEKSANNIFMCIVMVCGD